MVNFAVVSSFADNISKVLIKIHQKQDSKKGEVTVLDFLSFIR